MVLHLFCPSLCLILSTLVTLQIMDFPPLDFFHLHSRWTYFFMLSLWSETLNSFPFHSFLSNRAQPSWSDLRLHPCLISYSCPESSSYRRYLVFSYVHDFAQHLSSLRTCSSIVAYQFLSILQWTVQVLSASNSVLGFSQPEETLFSFKFFSLDSVSVNFFP